MTIMRPVAALAALASLAVPLAAQSRPVPPLQRPSSGGAAPATPAAATASAPGVVTVQPKLMVIPYTKEGEDIRTVLEEDVNKRLALTEIKGGFDARGFTTVDFVARLKAAKENNLFKSDDQSDIKTALVANSGADIYVQAELAFTESPGGNGCRVILTAYDVGTGNSLSNVVGESGRFNTTDYGKLCMRGVADKIEPFLNTMQGKFNEIVANGKSVVVDITVQQGASYNLSAEVGPQKDELRDALEQWFEENAYKNNYHIQGTTELRMMLDDVRIPLKDPATGNNYNPNKFASELVRYLKSLGLQADRQVKGNTIYISMK